MQIFTVFFAVVACAAAAPASYGTVNRATSYSYAASPVVAVLKHIQSLHEDGSYTFGYESADGSYRVENRDASGYIKGKYGYMDTYGVLQEVEYVAGNLAGQSVGYQARGTLMPEVSRNAAFPVVRPSGSRSVSQKTLDYEYNSVDEDGDGHPDSAPVTVVRTGAYDLPKTVEVVRVDPVPTYSAAPAVVRVVETPVASYAPAEVRVVETTKAASYEPEQAVVRVELPARDLQQYEVVSEQRTVVVEPKAQPIYQVDETVFRSPAPSSYVEPSVVVRTQPTSYTSQGFLEDFIRGLQLNAAVQPSQYEAGSSAVQGTQTDSDSVDVLAPFTRII